MKSVTENMKNQNDVLETGICLMVGIKRVNGEYVAWRVRPIEPNDGEPEDPPVWPTAGEAMESVLWECVDEVLSGKGDWEVK